MYQETFYWLKALKLLQPLSAILTVFILLTLHTLLPHYSGFYLVQLGLLFVGILLLFYTGKNLSLWFHHLSQILQQWLKEENNYSPRIPFSQHPALANLLQQCQQFTGKEQVLQQAQTHAQQHTSYLRILYDITSSINLSHDIKELLSQFLEIISHATHANAGTIRLLTPQGKMELVASLGLEKELTKKERITPIQRCMHGQSLIQNDIIFASDIKECERQSLSFEDSNTELVFVPLEYQGRKLGAYTLSISQEKMMDREALKVLLTSVARHLSIAIEKTYLDKELQRSSILEERTQMAHELHDSLAQTLASLRFQIASLEDSLGKNQPEVARLHGSINEAYQELRELISHFRAPIDKRGLVVALDNMIQDFKRKNPIAVYIQNEWTLGQLPNNLDLQVLRIAQEALNNIQKYSKSRNVRILLRSDPDGENKILIEDDGIGFDSSVIRGGPGEHIGLTVMEERAQRLGGILRIETEAGEGTRLILTFPAIAEY